MKISAIRDKVVAIRSEIRNAYIDFSEMTASAVAIHTDVVRDGRPVVGYGFNSNGRYSQSGILRDRMIPRLLRADPRSLLDDTGENLDPIRAWQVMMANEKPGGHGERPAAVGTVDMALWDAAAKIAGKPLYLLLADRFRNGQFDKEVYVYAAGGYYYPGKDIEGLTEEMRRYVGMGYDAVKIKIGGAALADDLRRIEAVLRILGPGQQLAVDANGRFDRAAALAYADALGRYPLKWYEEPCDPLDFELHAEVAAASTIPVATGENLFSLQDALNLVRYARLRPDRDFLQFDPALGYGIVEYLRILHMLHDHGWSSRRCIPHGGHQMALHLAAGLGLHGNESYPGVFQPFGGFADDLPISHGMIRLPDIPGIGIELKQNLFEVFRDL